MRYVYRRKHTYYFRYRVPKYLSTLTDCSEIKYSLHTTSYLEAVSLIAPLLQAIGVIKLVRKPNDVVVSALKTIREISSGFVNQPILVEKSERPISTTDRPVSPPRTPLVPHGVIFGLSRKIGATRQLYKMSASTS